MYMLFSRLHPLRHGDEVVRLGFLPQTLKISEVILLIIIFIGRQLLHVLGLGQQLTPRCGPAKDQDRYRLPKLSLSMPFRVSRQDLTRYAQAVRQANFESVLDNPAQTSLLLSALSMPAMLILLAHHKSPIRPLGALNVRNKFEILRPELCSEEVLLDLQGGEVRSTLAGEARRLKRGLEIDLSVEVVMHDENSEPVIIFRQVFTMLQFMKFKTPPPTPSDSDAVAYNESIWRKARSVSLKLPVEGPKVWAPICKDYNPIHMSTLAAKVLGFPGKIAHGNYALASAIAQLDSADELRTSKRRGKSSVEVQFRRPISLPAFVTAEFVQQDARTRFLRVMRNEKTYVIASLNISPAP